MPEKTLRQLRLEAGLSEMEVANLIGYPFWRYSTIEECELNAHEIISQGKKILMERLKDKPVDTLRRMRIRAGLTQKQTAQKIGCSNVTYNLVENGKYIALGIKERAMALFESVLKERKLANTKATLRELRQGAALTLKRAAEKLNCSRSYYNAIEIGLYKSEKLETAARNLFEKILKERET